MVPPSVLSEPERHDGVAGPGDRGRDVRGYPERGSDVDSGVPAAVLLQPVAA